jgi:DNA-binding PadR family transcriptional regulator
MGAGISLRRGASLKGLRAKPSDETGTVRADFPNGLGERFNNPAGVTELMSLPRNDVPWLQRGTQRAAVARALRKPMTGTEICSAARAINPHIQLRDVWHLLRQMQERELVHCLNPRLVTGRLYALTERGRDDVHAAFGIVVTNPPSNIDWRKYSWVVRAKIRRLTLIALGQLEAKTGAPQTATAIRKHLRSGHAVGLNPVIRALKDLLRLGLIQHSGVTEARACKLYRLTRMGHRILEQLQR